jgi:hypothetical protein
MSNKISKAHWENVLRTMEFYKRVDGYIDEEGKGPLLFFDSPPNDYVGMYVTKEQVKEYIYNYDSNIKNTNKEI